MASLNNTNTNSADTGRTADPFSAGQEALARKAWDEASTWFKTALTLGETPEALEGLGTASCLDDAATSFDARERAYRLYQERGDKRASARVATWLALDYLEFRGEAAIANGWFQKAHRLLKSVEPGVEHGWLKYITGHLVLILRNDAATVRNEGMQVAELGRSLPWSC